MGKKKLKATALPTNFCHIPPQKQKRKSPKKKLTYTPSPIKRARKSILEHSYAFNKLLCNDDTPTIINSNFTILHENSIDNLNSITDDIINPEIENYSEEKLLQQLKNIKKESLNRSKVIKELRHKINRTNKINSSTNIKTNINNINLKKNLKTFLTENQILSLNSKNKKDLLGLVILLKKHCDLNFHVDLLVMRNYLIKITFFLL